MGDRLRSCLIGRGTVRGRGYTAHGRVARATSTHGQDARDTWWHLDYLAGGVWAFSDSFTGEAPVLRGDWRFGGRLRGLLRGESLGLFESGEVFDEVDEVLGGHLLLEVFG